MQHPEAVTAVRMDEQQCVFALAHVRQGLLHIARSLYFVAVHFEDDVALLQSSIVGRTSRLYLLDHSAADVMRNLKLVAQFRRKVAETDAPAHFSVAFARAIFAVILAAA